MPPLRLLLRDPPVHLRLLPGGAGDGGRRTPPVRHPGPVFHHPHGAGHPAAHPRLRLLPAGEGVHLPGRRVRRGPLRDLPQGAVPGGRILPPQQRIPQDGHQLSGGPQRLLRPIIQKGDGFCRLPFAHLPQKPSCKEFRRP